MSKFTLPLRVRFAETDAMGVVYHGRYFEYLEMSRVALMDSWGLPYAKLVELGYHLPVVEAHAKYLKSARFDDRLNVTVTLQTLQGAKMTLGYQIHNGPELIFEGSTLHAFINKEGRPTRPPAEFVKIAKQQGAL